MRYVRLTLGPSTPRRPSSCCSSTPTCCRASLLVCSPELIWLDSIWETTTFCSFPWWACWNTSPDWWRLVQTYLLNAWGDFGAGGCLKKKDFSSAELLVCKWVRYLAQGFLANLGQITCILLSDSGSVEKVDYWIGSPLLIYQTKMCIIIQSIFVSSVRRCD